jgi:hypothetical protein
MKRIALKEEAMEKLGRGSATSGKKLQARLRMLGQSAKQNVADHQRQSEDRWNASKVAAIIRARAKPDELEVLYSIYNGYIR